MEDIFLPAGHKGEMIDYQPLQYPRSVIISLEKHPLELAYCCYIKSVLCGMYVFSAGRQILAASGDSVGFQRFICSFRMLNSSAR